MKYLLFLSLIIVKTSCLQPGFQGAIQVAQANQRISMATLSLISELHNANTIKDTQIQQLGREKDLLRNKIRRDTQDISGLRSATQILATYAISLHQSYQGLRQAFDEQKEKLIESQSNLNAADLLIDTLQETIKDLSCSSSLNRGKKDEKEDKPA